MDQKNIRPACLRVAAIQLPIVSEISTNADAIVDRIRCLGQHDLLVFPEFALSGRPHLEPSAEQAGVASLVSGSLARIREATADTRGLVIVPSLLPAANGRWTNSAVWLQRGTIVARHDKSLLTPAEEAWCDPGIAPKPITLDGVVYGLVLCVEGNGSETLGSLAMAGATVILQPSYPESPSLPWPKGTVDPWRVDIQALFPLRHRIRALIDQVNIIWVTPAGSGSLTRIISATGDIVAAALDERPTVVVAELDLSRFPFRNSPTFQRRQELAGANPVTSTTLPRPSAG